MTAKMDALVKRRCALRGVALMLAASFLFVFMAMVWDWPPSEKTLSDTDDYMRMVRVFDLLDGRDLPAYAAPRLGVDGAGEIGWSRLVDLPLMLVQGGMESFMPRPQAALWTATTVPAFATLLLILAAMWYVKPALPGRSLFFTFLAVLSLWALLRQFMPGRVDHHMWQALLGLVACGALVRLWIDPGRLLYALIAGAALGTGLAIGADILLWLTFLTILAGLFWLFAGAVFEKPGLVMALGVFGAAAFWHLLLHDPGRFIAESCDSLSVVWLALGIVTALFWGIIILLPARFKINAARRFAAGFVTGVPLLVMLYFFFPACFHDPYMIGDPLVREVWLSAVSEARPLSSLYEQKPLAAWFFVLPPLAGLAGAAWAFAAQPDRRQLWGGLGAILLCGTLLTFYQVRTVDFAQTVTILPLAWLLTALFDFCRRQLRRLNLAPRQRLAMALVFFGCSLAFFLYGLTHRQTWERGATETGADDCNLRQAAAALNGLAPPQMIAAYIDAGSEILYRTPHAVLAAPYHRNQAGILAAYEIITADGAAAARDLMARYGATVVMVCDEAGNLWTGENRLKKVIFADTLLRDEPPDWLAPVGTPEANGGYHIYRKVK